MQQYIELLISLQTSVTNLGSTGTVLAVKVILILEEMPEMRTMNDSENPPHNFWYTAGFSLYVFWSFFRKQK